MTAATLALLRESRNVVHELLRRSPHTEFDHWTVAQDRACRHCRAQRRARALVDSIARELDIDEIEASRAARENAKRGKA